MQSVWIDGLFDVLFPPSCAACGELGAEPFCALCGDAVLPAEPFEIEGVSRATAMFTFGGPVADALRHLKYHDRPDLGRPLGRAMRPGLERFEPFDIVIPMPPSKGRLVERGYDQARELTRGLGLPVEIGALYRVTEPPAQVGLDRAERLLNLQGAFRPGPVSVQSQRILLVDDIVTTGATLKTAAAALLAANAADIQCFAFARTS